MEQIVFFPTPLSNLMKNMKVVCKCVSHPIQACPLHSPKMHQSVHPQRPELSTHSPNKLVATENLAPRGVAVKIGRIIQLSVSLQCSAVHLAAT